MNCQILKTAVDLFEKQVKLHEDISSLESLLQTDESRLNDLKMQKQSKIEKLTIQEQNKAKVRKIWASFFSRIFSFGEFSLTAFIIGYFIFKVWSFWVIKVSGGGYDRADMGIFERIFGFLFHLAFNIAASIGALTLLFKISVAIFESMKKYRESAAIPKDIEYNEPHELQELCSKVDKQRQRYNNLQNDLSQLSLRMNDYLKKVHWSVSV